MVNEGRGGPEAAKKNRGGFTKVPNAILEKLAKTDLSIGELRLCLFVVRKTCGFHKAGDALAVSVMAEGTGLTKRAVRAILSRLRNRRLLLCQPSQIRWKGTLLNQYSINKNIDTWLPKARNGGAGVNGGAVRGERPCQKGVNGGAPTKERTKEITKERESLMEKDSGELHQTLVGYWCNHYEQKLGVAYDYREGKEGSHLKEMLKIFGEERLRLMIDAFMDSQDAWIRENGGYTIAVFRTQANKIAQSLAQGHASVESFMTVIPREL